MVGWEVALLGYSGPRPWVNGSQFGSRVFAVVPEFRLLRWGGYPGSSRWALNAISRVFIIERQREREEPRDGFCPRAPEGPCPASTLLAAQRN